MRALFALILLFITAGAAAQQGPAPPAPLQEGPAPPREAAPTDPARSVVLIFSHGTYRPQRRHQCNEDRDVPAVLREMAAANGWVVQYLCSAATDDGVEGSYTYKRADEILAAVAAQRARGVPARRIFLLGHSAGGWSSLMAARKDPSGFNAVIAFAPAFAGVRNWSGSGAHCESERGLCPQWRSELMPRQMKYIREAKRIDALIFAYSDDQFDRPAELAPLESIPGVRIIAFDACQDGHATTYSDCFREGARVEIEDYIKTRLKAP
jgi:pimeloyl-ACP methyl ester carboxylesterase